MSTTERDEIVARGEQVVASMRRVDAGLSVCALPDDLLRAIEPYAAVDIEFAGTLPVAGC